jgi:G:T-mismatch repair DNA endonuclease (very short patch repair protein)
LRDRVDAYRGRGKRRAAAALERIREGAESRPETLVRLALVDAGLPEPEVNVDIHDEAGRFLGRGDLVYRRWRLVVEYDGDQHRVDTMQFDRDVRRLDDLAAAGWRVIRVVGRSFFQDCAATVERVARALLAAGWRPR